MKRSPLISKYDVAVPRYTSYPTVPYWSEVPPTEAQWIQSIKSAVAKNNSSWSIYIHIPFCESLCTYCGCNNLITRDHKKSMPYIERVLNEFKNYKRLVPELFERPLKHIHIGGGTPTYLSSDELGALLKPILDQSKIDPNEFHASIEVDPRRTSLDQLKTLRELGFRRISMGVQDFDPEVQRMMNRTQPLQLTKDLTENARALGYTSVNYDLIYGLAKQNLDCMRTTVEKTIELRPDRIALYSLAIVPWIKPAQRLFKDEDLPPPELKRELYETAREMFLNAGYVEIGMDHFALPNDPLTKAMHEKYIHRNFMGYTETRTDVLLGLGVSAISESPTCFHQNEKVISKYEQRIDSGELATHRGQILSEQDLVRREQILQFMTLGEVAFENSTQENDAKNYLSEMLNDHLVEIKSNKLLLTKEGRPFLRNACVFFDEHLRKKKPDTRIFSSSI